MSIAVNALELAKAVVLTYCHDAIVRLYLRLNVYCTTHAGNRLADHKAKNRRLTMGEMLIEGSEGTLRLDGDGGLWLRSHGKLLNNDAEPDVVAIFPCRRHIYICVLVLICG